MKNKKKRKKENIYVSMFEFSFDRLMDNTNSCALLLFLLFVMRLTANSLKRIEVSVCVSFFLESVSLKTKRKRNDDEIQTCAIDI